MSESLIQPTSIASIRDVICCAPPAAITGRVAATMMLQAAPEDQRLLYSALIESALSQAARKAFEMLPGSAKFFSESQHRSHDRGVTEGKASALLTILARRGLVITDDQRRQIVGCTDAATVERWLDRALSVASVDELLG